MVIVTTKFNVKEHFIKHVQCSIVTFCIIKFLTFQSETECFKPSIYFLFLQIYFLSFMI